MSSNARGVAIALGILLVIASPLVFFLGLELLPRHGDVTDTADAMTVARHAAFRERL